ncbi:MAG: ubiquinol-cytochrome c reductase cytochrome c subunit [Frankiaceae bacterium]|jgi:ubiquinol-cytochrome c reductase cytochrome c subunit|nr:ubiquinol-cytochrome c reductase cytochrome c subunit [Frankiaceae bacterium]MDQ1648655.1 ubiquinol-cytochrome c reductase cytochrome c subunit [Frankiaceae bacterium]
MTAVRSARPRRLPTTFLLLLALIALAVLWAAFAPKSSAAEAEDPNLAVREGRALFLVGCSSCHGLDAQGGNQAPSLIGVGAAAVDFQVGTGRMPLAAPAAQAARKTPLYNETQIRQLAAYVDSLAPGPAIPTVNLADGDLAYGGELFRTNCAQCHQASGQGGALTNGKYAPNLGRATPTQVGEAMRTGPESMPVFSPAQLNDHQVNSIAKYVEFLNNPKSPGGHPIGSYGPVPEGLVAWLVGIGGLVVATLWIGSRIT